MTVALENIVYFAEKCFYGSVSMPKGAYSERDKRRATRFWLYFCTHMMRKKDINNNCRYIKLLQFGSDAQRHDTREPHERITTLK